MDEKELDSVAAFDTLFTTNQIQMLKILLPCLDPSLQNYLAVLIKYQELIYTISCLKEHPFSLLDKPAQKADPQTLLPALLPYCSPAQKQMLSQLEQTFSAMKNYQEMMELMELMQAMTEENDIKEDNDTYSKESDSPQAADALEATDDAQAADDPKISSMPGMEFLLSMLEPEQKELFKQLKGGFFHDRTDLDS